MSAPQRAKQAREAKRDYVKDLTERLLAMAEKFLAHNYTKPSPPPSPLSPAEERECDIIHYAYVFAQARVAAGLEKDAVSVAFTLAEEFVNTADLRRTAQTT